MVALSHSATVPSWDERARAEELRLLRDRCRRARDGYLPAHVLEHGRVYWLRRLRYPYAVQDS